MDTKVKEFIETLHFGKEMNVLQYLISLKPAIPMSVEKPCTQMSNSELRRHIQQGGVLINHEKWDANEMLDVPVFSLIFFPNGKRRTTLV